MSAASWLAVIFWAGIATTMYAYVVFPVLAELASRSRKTLRAADGRPFMPHVTVIVPAYNEERSLETRIRNVLASEYPRDLLDVLVVSDASTDRTDEIARAFEAEGVRLIVQERRRGKTAGLNRAMGMARGTIVVFTDANASFPPSTIATLVRYFVERRIGLVSGYTKYTVQAGGQVAEATNAYTTLERIIKRGESRWGCCVGADGAIFAMRRSLYRRLREDDINDFVLPLRVIEQGYQCVLAEDAFCSEHPGDSLESEFRRQSRITNRSLRALWRHAHLLNPFRFPLFAFSLFSHKVVRFLVPVALAASLCALFALAPGSGLYTVLAAAAVLAIALLGGARARPGLAAPGRPWTRPLQMLDVFVTMNLAALHGWGKFLSGYAEVTWQHDRALTR